MSHPSLYDVLGVNRNATHEEVKVAYQKLILKFHPDKVADGERESALETFLKVQNAWKTLGDPQSRNSYDNDANLTESLGSTLDIPLFKFLRDSLNSYEYSCRCGDIFKVSQAELDEGYTIVQCSTCSLTINIV